MDDFEEIYTCSCGCQIWSIHEDVMVCWKCSRQYAIYIGIPVKLFNDRAKVRLSESIDA